MRQRRGFALVATTLFAAVLVAFVGLAIDVGYLQWQKLRAQTAADAAANGAVLEVRKASSNTAITSAGQADASLNGFTNGANNTTVTINHPPLSGPQAGNVNAVEALVARTLPTFFMAIVGQMNATVGARAVSMLGGGAGGGCVYSLNPNVPRAFQIAGGNSTYLACGVLVSSSSSTAFHMEGSSKLYLKNNAAVSVFGGVDLTGQTRILNFTTGQNVTATKPSSPPADPLSAVAAPSAGGMTVRGNSHTYYDMNAKPSGNTIQPGVYCGGLQIGSTGGATFTMAPGVYVMAGGGFQMGSQGKVDATGVTIYNTSGPNSGVAGCNAAFAPFNLDGQANIHISAPTSGPLEGIAFFQDRNITNATANQFVGGSSSLINGAIYLLHSPLVFSGNNSVGGYLILVADTITINGDSTVNNDYSSLQDGSPIKSNAVLAE